MKDPFSLIFQYYPGVLLSRDQYSSKQNFVRVDEARTPSNNNNNNSFILFHTYIVVN